MTEKNGISELKIIAALENDPPFDVEAVAVEQDTLLIMGTEPIEYPRESFKQLIEEMNQIKPLTPGTIVVKGKKPFRFLAIVHDVNEIPTWREEWIVSAFDGIFQESEKRKLQSIAVPLLGTLHGSMDKERCSDLLMSALERADLKYLKRVWLILHLKMKFFRRG